MRAFFKTIAILALALLPLQARADLFDLIVTVGVVVALGPAGMGAAALLSWGQVALTIGLAVYGQYQADQQRRQLDKARNAYNASLEDRTITSVSSEAPFVRVYGRARVGSAVVAILPSGARDEYQHIIAIHAAHECDGFEEIYIAKKALGELDADGFAINSPDYSSTSVVSQDNTGTSWTIDANYVPNTVQVFEVIDYGDGSFGTFEVPFTQNGNTITVAASAAYRTYYSCKKSSVRVKKHLGVPGEAADATLIAEVGDKWDAASKLSGFCYTYIRLDLNQREFQGGLPAIEALLRGAKLYDPRSTTTVWSQNPALALYDYLRCDFCAVPSGEIPVADVIAAADVCDEAINIGARYTLNGTVTSAQDQTTTITQMAQAMAGGIDGTTWRMWAGKYVAPTLALQQQDIVGALAITPGLSDADVCNGVTGRFIGAENDHIVTDMKPYQNAAYLAADGRELFHGLEFPFTDETVRCHNLARIYVEDQRNSFTVKGVFSLKAWDTTIGQRVTLTSVFFGWSTKIFRVVGKTYNPAGTVELLLKEDTAQIWNLADAVVVDATPNTRLPNPFQIAAPASLTLASGTAQLLLQSDGTVLSRVLATWPPSASIYAAQAEIQVKPYLNSSWKTVALVDAEAGEHYITALKDGATYDFRIRFVNPYLQTQSTWRNSEPHRVIGKTDPPANVGPIDAAPQGARLELSWPDEREPDFRGYEVRALDENWGATAGHVYKGPDPRCTVVPPVAGVQGTWFVRKFDTTGNYSAASSQVDYTTAEIAGPDEITHSFNAANATSASITLDWSDVEPPFGLKHYRVEYGSTVKTVKASTITLPADWTGDRTYTVKPVDSNGNISAGTAIVISKLAPNVPTAMAGQVVDNNVQLTWTAGAVTTLPVSHYKLYKGDTWAAAQAAGARRVDTNTITVQESAAGTRTYWLTQVDTGNTESAAVSVTKTTWQPPDYSLVTESISTFAGTKVNALLEGGALTMLVNTTQTFAQHFTSQGWTTPQDQIDAGFPIFAQPGTVTASYEEIVDAGAIISSARVLVEYTLETVAGSVSAAVTITTAQDSGFTVGVQTYSGDTAFPTNFRYRKIKIDVTATDNTGLAKLTALSSKVDAKLRTEQYVATLTLGGAHPQGNQIAEYISTWAAGMTMPPTGYSRLGDATENAMQSVIAPSGLYEPAWACIDYDTGTGNDGGFFAADVTFDWAASGLLMACFVKKNTTDGNFRMALQDLVTNFLTIAGGTPGNVLTHNRDMPNTTDWFLVTTYIHPKGYAGADTGASGVYTLAGTKSATAAEFKAGTGASIIDGFQSSLADTTLGTGLAIQWLLRPALIACSAAAAPDVIGYLLRCATGYGASVELPADCVDVAGLPPPSISSVIPAVGMADFTDIANPKRFNVFATQAGTATFIGGQASGSYRMRY